MQCFDIRVRQVLAKDLFKKWPVSWATVRRGREQLCWGEHLCSPKIHMLRPKSLCCCALSQVWLLATPRTIAHQAPSSVQGILQAAILSWLPFPSPGDLSHPGIKPTSLSSTSSALAGGFLTTMSPGKPVLIPKMTVFASWDFGR